MMHGMVHLTHSTKENDAMEIYRFGLRINAWYEWDSEMQTVGDSWQSKRVWYQKLVMNAMSPEDSTLVINGIQYKVQYASASKSANSQRVHVAHTTIRRANADWPESENITRNAQDKIHRMLEETFTAIAADSVLCDSIKTWTREHWIQRLGADVREIQDKLEAAQERLATFFSSNDMLPPPEVASR